MKYPTEWKRRGLSVGPHGIVSDMVSGVLGNVHGISSPSAKSPGGMVTDTIWTANRNDGESQEFQSKTLAIEWLIEGGKK